MSHFLYGLIGFPLSHSFSQKYFTDKFARKGLTDCSYKNFQIGSITELHDLLAKNTDLCGFNVTIPYKEQVIPCINELDDISAQVRSVNTVQVMRKDHAIYLKGYNTDVYGFSRSLQEWFVARSCPLPAQALVLGTGGASKAIMYALHRLNIEAHAISRHASTDVYKTYLQLNAKDICDHQLIVNATPLGMYPNLNECPDIPYQYITGKHFLYDLIYNPEETLFLNKGKERGATVHNGRLMLHLQADKAWEIWKNPKDIKII